MVKKAEDNGRERCCIPWLVRLCKGQQDTNCEERSPHRPTCGRRGEMASGCCPLAFTRVLWWTHPQALIAHTKGVTKAAGRRQHTCVHWSVT